MNHAQERLLDEAANCIAAAHVLLQSGFPGYAASRAYYAMFHVAEAMLDSVAMAFSSHAAVIAAFGREFAKTGKLPAEFHRWLIEAQSVRQTGDYMDSQSVTPEQAQKQIDRASQFLSHVRGSGH
jgi:uncharacterized protein (UPF0332 family)